MSGNGKVGRAVLSPSPDAAARRGAVRTPRPTPLHEDSAPYRTGAPSIARHDAAKAEQCSALQPLRFIDLFCGIGGFRLAFERAGARCVFSSDWDKYSRQTYAANFGETPHGDIHSVAVADIPKFDILCGGFPCQPFSLAGVSKKNSLGRKHGFEDVKQGNLFFSIADILEYHQPPAFVLENVKHLVRHDQGRTFEIIYDTLTNALGYQVYWRIINAQSVVPQSRQRIFLVGFKPGRAHSSSRNSPPKARSSRASSTTMCRTNTRSPTICGNTFRTTPRSTRQRAMGLVSDLSRAMTWREPSAPATNRCESFAVRPVAAVFPPRNTDARRGGRRRG